VWRLLLGREAGGAMRAVIEYLGLARLTSATGGKPPSGRSILGQPKILGAKVAEVQIAQDVAGLHQPAKRRERLDTVGRIAGGQP
jgi:hypothetical protein